MRRGTTLVEAGLAMALLCALIASSLYLMMGTVRSARRSSDLLAEGILSQLAVRCVRDAVLTNPKYLENLESRYGFKRVADGKFESFGTAVAHPQPVQTPEGALGQSRLLIEAFGRSLSAPALPGGVAEATTLGEDERRAVLQSMENLAVRITLSDGARRMEFQNITYNDGSLKELIKQVDVAVYWLSSAAPGEVWAPAYTLQDQILTPVESLTTTAVSELQAAFDRMDLGSSIAEIRTLLSTKEAFQRYDEDTREIAARIFFIYREANVESFLTQGRAVSVKAKGNTRPIDEQIRELYPQTAPYLQKKLAMAYVKKAQIIFDAFRKVKTALSDLSDRHKLFETEVRAARTNLTALLIRAKAVSKDIQKPLTSARFAALSDDLQETLKGYEQYLASTKPLIQKALLFEYLVNDPRTAAALNRLARYPARFKDSLRRAANVYASLAANTEASWLARADATTQWVEVTTAISLLPDAPGSSGAPRELTALSGQWRSAIPYLADFLEQADLARAALPELSARNPGFTGALPVFESLAHRSSPVLQVAGRYMPAGGMTIFLDDSGRVPVYLYTAALGSGRGAARAGLTQGQARVVIEKLTRALREPLELAVRVGLVSVAELSAPRLPGQVTRLARSRGASALTSGGKGPVPEGLAPPTPASPSSSPAPVASGATPAPSPSPDAAGGADGGPRSNRPEPDSGRDEEAQGESR